MDVLGDLKVVEVSKSIPGAYCGMLLSDYGAEVIKVEEPGAGDESRKYGPFPHDVPNPEASGLFLYLNRNKLGITLNLADALGLKILGQLCAKADILILSMTPAEAEKLHYEDLAQANPRLIILLITPFGLLSPYKDYSATELVLSHASGLPYFTPGDVEDIERDPPLRLAGRQTELMAGLCGADAALIAVAYREKTGAGQVVDVATPDGSILTNMWNLSAISYTGIQPTRAVGVHPNAPSHILPCKDGYIQLSCNEEAHWKKFVELIGNPEWAGLEIFKDRPTRGANWDALRPLLLDVLQNWEKDVITPLAQSKGIPCTVVATPADLVGSKHLAERKFFTQIEHPVAGKVTYPGEPIQMSETPWHHRRRAPYLGEHNEEILCQRLGYSKSELVVMRASGVI